MRYSLLLLVMAIGCGTAGDTREERMTESEVAALDDGEQQAILAVANVASEAELVGEAGLPVDAARAIMEFRAGADGLPDTQDDVLIDSIATLDSLPWVGPIAINVILGWAFNPGFNGGYGLPIFVSHSAVLTDASAIKTDSRVLLGTARPVVTYLETFVYGRNPDALYVHVVFYDEFRVAQLWGRGPMYADGSFAISVATDEVSLPYTTTCGGFGFCVVQDERVLAFSVAGGLIAPGQIAVTSYVASGLNGTRYAELWRNTYNVAGYVFGAQPTLVEYRNTLPLTGLLIPNSFGWTPAF